MQIDLNVECSSAYCSDNHSVQSIRLLFKKEDISIGQGYARQAYRSLIDDRSEWCTNKQDTVYVTGTELGVIIVWFVYPHSEYSENGKTNRKEDFHCSTVKQTLFFCC